MDRQLTVKTIYHNTCSRHIKRRGLHAGGDFAYRNAITGVCYITPASATSTLPAIAVEVYCVESVIVAGNRQQIC